MRYLLLLMHKSVFHKLINCDLSLMQKVEVILDECETKLHFKITIFWDIMLCKR
jgi:hypothetical protein